MHIDNEILETMLEILLKAQPIILDSLLLLKRHLEATEDLG